MGEIESTRSNERNTYAGQFRVDLIRTDRVHGTGPLATDDRFRPVGWATLRPDAARARRDYCLTAPNVRPETMCR